jgi:hypothetical protein
MWICIYCRYLLSRLYNTCMAKNDDAPPVIPDTSHLGDDVETFLGSRPGTSTGGGSVSENSTTSAGTSLDFGQSVDEVFCTI